jgi:hypothetical protein
VPAPDGPARADGPAPDGPTGADGPAPASGVPAPNGPASNVLSYRIFDKHISYRNIVIQLVYINILIQPEISTFGFLGCLGYFFLFRLSGLRQLLALCPFSPQFPHCTS